MQVDITYYYTKSLSFVSKFAPSIVHTYMYETTMLKSSDLEPRFDVCIVMVTHV